MRWWMIGTGFAVAAMPLAAQEVPDPPAIDNAGSLSSSSDTSSSTTSVTTTESSSTTIVVGQPEAAPAAFGQPAGMALAGRWQLGKPGDGSSCGITLSTKKWSGDRFLAQIPAGCPNGIFGANSWRAVGGRLELNNGGGDAVAQFRAAGPNRWEGSVVSTGDAVTLSR